MDMDIIINYTIQYGVAGLALYLLYRILVSYKDAIDRNTEILSQLKQTIDRNTQMLDIIFRLLHTNCRQDDEK